MCVGMGIMKICNLCICTCPCPRPCPCSKNTDVYITSCVCRFVRMSMCVCMCACDFFVTRGFVCTTVRQPLCFHVYIRLHKHARMHMRILITHVCIHKLRCCSYTASNRDLIHFIQRFFSLVEGTYLKTMQRSAML